MLFFFKILQEGFVVRTINTLSNPVTVTSELPLKLARKCVDVFGWAIFDEEQTPHTLSSGCDDEIVTVVAGKEFSLLKTLSGKMLYSGKGSCLGMKSNTRSNRWLELTLTKGARVTQFAAGHDGQHVILVMDDGSVFFAGTARRGEDGDSSESFAYFTNFAFRVNSSSVSRVLNFHLCYCTLHRQVSN